MMWFLKHTNALCEEQGGFLPVVGTNDTIGKFLSNVYDNINNGHPTLSIFFDLKKAFVTIDHSELLRKLNYLGFCRNSFHLLKDYLSNRTQHTRINGITSEEYPMTCGVPQGSTLGPLLFIFYINDLPIFINGVKIRLYAGDSLFH